MRLKNLVLSILATSIKKENNLLHNRTHIYLLTAGLNVGSASFSKKSCRSGVAGRQSVFNLGYLAEVYSGHNFKDFGSSLSVSLSVFVSTCLLFCFSVSHLSVSVHHLTLMSEKLPGSFIFRQPPTS